jgi:hypothetical protein
VATRHTKTGKHISAQLVTVLTPRVAQDYDCANVMDRTPKDKNSSDSLYSHVVASCYRKTINFSYNKSIY